MTLNELAKRFLDAWNQKDIKAVLKLTHPQASFYNAFWGETCSGDDLPKFLRANFDEDTRWYKMDGEVITTLNGMVARYIAFSNGDPEGLHAIYNGAEIFTISDGLIMTVSDFYCDPNPVDLIEISKFVEKQHGRANIVPLGLSAKASNAINRRLRALAEDGAVFLEPTLTVTQLADHVGCSVMHLFYVLEEEKQTTFLQFVNECRVRIATSVIETMPRMDISLDLLAKQSGFRTTKDFNTAFTSTFSMSAEEYVRKFGQ